jgi:hypothetical protein
MIYSNFRNGLAIALIVVGLLALITNLMQIDLWRYIFPASLIAIGLLMLYSRQRLNFSHSSHPGWMLGKFRRQGKWQVRSENIRLVAGEALFDFREALFPEKTATIRLTGVGGKLTFLFSDRTGWELNCDAMGSVWKINGVETEFVMEGGTTRSANFETALHQVILIIKMVGAEIILNDH